MPIEPDAKDWTWVLEQPCPDCGFEAAAISVTEIAQLTRDNVAQWVQALAHPDAAFRPADNVWSALEYGAHVRDVHSIFAGRVRQMLIEDDPIFANWDQDATAVEERYGEQDPSLVSHELADAAKDVATAYDAVSGDQWARPGRRNNGSVFTIATLAKYHLHDVIHHTHDIAPPT